MKLEALKTYLETHYKFDVCAIPGDGIRVCDFGEIFPSGDRLLVVQYSGPEARAELGRIMTEGQLTAMLGDAFYLRRLAEIESEFF